jgi:L,D-transpeptidase ErfK/SrfK
MAEKSPPPLLGENRIVTTEAGVSLMELAILSGVGFQNLLNANPGIDPWVPNPGAQVVIPKQAIFPGTPATGLTINLAELRIFHLAGTSLTGTTSFYPLGIGRAGWETPEGEFRLIEKVENPFWRIPQGIKEENPELPDFIPPGPNNPLGKYWLGLSVPGYGLHGTNKPYGVGRRVSHGCIRLYDQDIRMLYQTVDPGEKVRIVYLPVKATSIGRALFLEVHPDYLNRFPDLFQEALRQISRLGWNGQVSYERVLAVVSEQRGLPETVGQR